MYVLGMDTSNYTTSICAIRLDTGELVADARQVLPVHAGHKGLRQSDALFLHVQQIPLVYAELRRQLGGTSHEGLWSGAAVSVRPRPFADSYMPVFTTGQSFMTTLAHTLGLPLVQTSHQEGHLAAADHFLTGFDQTKPYFGVHLSGGTSDVVLARSTAFGYQITTLGEGLDLHAGQFVDRVGVKLGLRFPAGAALEKLARSHSDGEEESFRLPSRVIGAQMSFSGPCAAALRALDESVSPTAVAFAVEQSIANSVVKALTHVSTEHPTIEHAVVAGGVAANEHIRARITARLAIMRPHLEVHYAPVRFSSDNALGVAAIGRRFLLSNGVYINGV